MTSLINSNTNRFSLYQDIQIFKSNMLIVAFGSLIVGPSLALIGNKLLSRTITCNINNPACLEARIAGFTMVLFGATTTLFASAYLCKFAALKCRGRN